MSSRVLAGIGFALALGVFLYLCFADTYERTTGGVSVEHSSSTLIEENGIGILAWLALPLLLSALALVLSMGRTAWSRMGLWAVAVCSLGFVMVGIFSVGMLFAPAALALIAAAATSSSHPRARDFV